MIVPAYTPGEWLAVVTHGCVAFLPASTSEATLHRVWDSLRSGDDAVLVDHLQVLALDGLTALPPFALLSVADGRLHAAVRGSVEVHVAAATGDRVLTAPQVSTWSEEVVEGLEQVTVRATGATVGAGTGQDTAVALPLLSGVVRASTVRISLVERAADGVEGDRAREHQAWERLAADAASDVSAADPFGAEPSSAAFSRAPLPAATAVATLIAPAPCVTALRSPVPAGDALLVDGEPIDNTLLRPAPAGDAEVTPSAPALPEHPAPLGTARTGAVAAEPHAVTVTPDADASTDHDGTTVLGAEMVALRSQLPEWSGHLVTGPLVVPAPATPTPARLALSTGQRVVLSRPVLIGRAPQASRVTSTQVPQLVTVPSPLQDISRTHAEVRMDGDDVVLTDLCSTNGVIVVRPSAAPQRLQPGEATVLLPGVLVDLGEGVTFTVERSA